MQPITGGVLLFLFGVLATPAGAQQRTITGTITDSLSGQPLASAIVSVQGGTGVVTTREAGQFTLAVPAGRVVLLVRALGYRRREVVVAADQTTVPVALSRDVFRIEEIVVTGLATGVERRNLANAVATVDASDLNFAPTASIEQQLQGKVAGADIQSNSGAPGGGLQVRLRGVTSINADAQPLYVVDGIIMSDIAIPSNQNAVTAASGGSNPTLTQDAQVNRIADLNPNDIESIEILKGASASAIYGGRASNGVVIIHTKRGAPGAPRFSVTQRFGSFDLMNKLEFRRWKDAAEIDAAFGPGTAAANNFTPGTFFDLEEQLAGRHSLSHETIADVSGGDANTKYFASGVVKNDKGIIQNTGFQRQGVRLNLDQKLSNRANVQVSTDVTHTKARRGLTNNDNASVSFYMVLPFTPTFVDLRRQPDGTFKNNTFIPSNPLQTAALMKNEEDVWRFNASTKTTLNAYQSERQTLQLSATGGLDFFNQTNTLFFPPELQFEPADGLPGSSLLSNSDNLNLNLDGSAVHTYTGSGFSLTTSGGAQYARRNLNISRIVSKNLVAGQQNVDAGTNVQVVQDRQTINDLGFFVQSELLTLNDKLLLTAGVRADQSSLNADDTKLFYYPKFAASYRIERPDGGFLRTVKFRSAYGESGNQPLFGQIFTPLAATNNINGLPGLVTAGTTGSDKLSPERQREIEGGIDATLFNDRVSLETTVYQRSIKDLLLTRTLAPSTGFNSEIFNGGKLRVRGIEAALSVVPVQTRNVLWFLRTNFALNRSKITDLPVPPFLNAGGGFGTSLGAFQMEEGKSATQIVGNVTLPNGSIAVRKVGDANPDFRMSFTQDLSWKRLSVHTLVDYQQGSEIINLTKFLADLGQVTKDFVPNGQQRLATFGGNTKNYIESATFVKIREITLSYDLPQAFIRSTGAGIRSARLSVSGRNLFTFTPYSGLDPEVSNFGNQAVARNIDVAPFPPSRSYFFSLDIGF